MKSNERLSKKVILQKLIIRLQSNQSSQPQVVFIEISSNIIGWQIGFTPDDKIGSNLGFKPKVIDEEYKLSDCPVKTLSFDNIFLEKDISRGMIFKGKRSGLFHNFTMDVDPGCKYFEYSGAIFNGI